MFLVRCGMFPFFCCLSCGCRETENDASIHTQVAWYNKHLHLEALPLVSCVYVFLQRVCHEIFHIDLYPCFTLEPSFAHGSKSLGYPKARIGSYENAHLLCSGGQGTPWLAPLCPTTVPSRNPTGRITSQHLPWSLGWAGVGGDEGMKMGGATHRCIYIYIINRWCACVFSNFCCQQILRVEGYPKFTPGMVGRLLSVNCSETLAVTSHLEHLPGRCWWCWSYILVEVLHVSKYRLRTEHLQAMHTHSERLRDI